MKVGARCQRKMIFFFVEDLRSIGARCQRKMIFFFVEDLRLFIHLLLLFVLVFCCHYHVLRYHHR